MNKPHSIKKISRLAPGLSGRALEASLKKAGLTKYRLAKDLGIAYRVVQYWAAGKYPSESMAQRVAAYLGIQVASVDDHASILARLSRIESHLGIKATP